MAPSYIYCLLVAIPVFFKQDIEFKIHLLFYFVIVSPCFVQKMQLSILENSNSFMFDQIYTKSTTFSHLQIDLV
jgi:hypothetical protein